MTGGPGKEHRTNQPPSTRRVQERSKGDTACPTTSQNPFWHPSWLNKVWTTRKDSESKEEVKLLSRVRLFVTPWTVAYQSPLSMGYSRQEYWSELPFPSPGDLPDPGIEPRYPALQADSLTSESPGMSHSYTLQPSESE